MYSCGVVQSNRADDDTGGYTWEAGNKHSWKDLANTGKSEPPKDGSGEAAQKKVKRQ